MTKHQKIDALAHIDRRTFIVGTAGNWSGDRLRGAENLAKHGRQRHANAEPTIWSGYQP